MKKAISVLLCLLLFFSSVNLLYPAVADEQPSAEEIAAKNYPVPEGYEVSRVLASYDTWVVGETTTGLFSVSRSSEEGTAYYGSSMHYTAAQNNREVRAFSSSESIEADGYCFWFKSDRSASFRVRNAEKNWIYYYGSIPAAPEGQWVTVYNYGKFENMTINSSSSRTNLTSEVENGTKINFFLMSNSSTFDCYIDEFFTFTAKETPADSYEGDEDSFYKFSRASMLVEKNMKADYTDDGSVTLSSAYGSTASQYLLSATYNVNAEAAAAAIARANSEGGTGYLKFSIDNISCLNADGSANQYFTLAVSLDGLERSIKLYNIDVGEIREYYIDVSGIEDCTALTGVSISLQSPSSASKVRDVSIKLSPITVYTLPEGSVLYQAEDLTVSCHTSRSAEPYEPNVNTSSDGNNTYILPNSSDAVGAYIKIMLPDLEIGEYNVYASSYEDNARSTYMLSGNDKAPIRGVSFKSALYGSYATNRQRLLGSIIVDRENSYFKLMLSAKASKPCQLDYFIFERTDTVVEAEKAENLKIYDYPTMDRYEIKTILDRYDEFISGTDSRWGENQVSGNRAEGTAFNLNSRGTVGKIWFDNNSIFYGKSLDGDGIRFWYKASSTADLQFKGNGVTTLSKKLAALPEGGWVTIYYTDVVANGDLTAYNSLALKTHSAGAFYFDELHSIQQQIGDVIYEVRDGKAYVTGYDLRLEDVTLQSVYNGCPVVGIDEGALAGSKTLKTITLPASITSIGAGAFEGCLNLRSIDMPGVTTIGENAFLSCERLGVLQLPACSAQFDNTAFTGCTALTLAVNDTAYGKQYAIANGLRYSDSINGIDYICENGEITLTAAHDITALVIPGSIDGFPVTRLADGFMSGDTALVSVTAPANLAYIGKTAFSGCAQLSSVNFAGVREVGESAFSGCAKLLSVTLGEQLETLGAACFKNCTQLPNIKLPDSLTYASDDSFSNCTQLVVSITEGTYAYEYANRVGLKYIPATSSDFKYFVINYEATIISYTGSAVDITIPDSIDGYSVVAVGDSAFKNYTALKTLDFGDSCSLIDIRAFYGCSGLESIDFGNVLKINAYAFYNCIGLTELSLRDLVEVSKTAFEGCINLNLTVEKTQFLRTALKFVEGMTAGWNLGNTFDAFNSAYTYGTLTPAQSETLWGADTTSQEIIDLVCASGFNTIRIPVTWQAFLDENDDIDPAYLKRVKEVIGYAQKNNMYIILNIHHDEWLNLDTPDFDAMLAKFVHVWEQLADAFKYYDEKLILEAFNEVIDGGDWYGQDGDKLRQINTLNQAFHETVRNSGGLNNLRYLMLETYGAQYGDRHVNAMWIPEDDDHIIASVHMYINTMHSSHYTPNLERVYNKFVKNGVPCVIGEVGIPIWYDEEYCANWAEFYLKMCNQYQLKCVFWDDHGNYTMMNRAGLRWMYPSFIEKIAAMTNPEEPDYSDLIDPTTAATTTIEQQTTAATTAAVTTEATTASSQITTQTVTTALTTAAPQTTAATTTATTAATTEQRTLLYGDVNGDGSLNAKDILRLKQYLADWAVTLDFEATDVNLDSAINAKDLLPLRRYLAGWEITLGAR